MKSKHKIQSICIYCASSEAIDRSYFEAADQLARTIFEEGMEIVCGGGKVGLMGQLADTAKEVGGTITGILPTFMIEIEKQHPGLTRMIEVETMSERKLAFLDHADALVMLPGGTGTFEEFFEAVTLKRLGKITHPIVLLNTGGYYDPLLALMHRAVEERFMDDRHVGLYSAVDQPEEVLPALFDAPLWKEEYAKYAAVTKK